MGNRQLYSGGLNCCCYQQAVYCTNIFPNVILLLKNVEPQCRRNAALVICEVCKHTPDLAQLVVDAGSAPALVDNISDVHSHERLPGLHFVIKILSIILHETM